MKAGRMDCEVLVCGAGPIGSALAGLLAQAGLSCMLVDGRPEVPAPDAADPRALALTPASRAVLEYLGAWERLPRAGVGRFERMHVWDEGGRGSIDFDCAEVCAPALGYIVPQPLLQEALDGRIRSLPGVASLRGAGVTGIEWHADRFIARLADGGEVAARVAVAADGARSALRELAGIPCPVRSYGQEAVACLVRTERPHANVARQRFLRTGPLAFLPLAESDRCGIVWSTTPEHARELLGMDTAAFNAALGSAFEGTLGRVLDSSPRSSFPLAAAHAERYVRGRLVLAGDAAHCVHPLAGQGANLGLLDVAALAQLLAEARACGRDPGAARVLRSYERWRRGENALMAFALDALKRLFEPGSGPLPALRNLGLDAVDRSGFLKRAIMRRAMGIEGDVPVVARSAHPGLHA